MSEINRWLDREIVFAKNRLKTSLSFKKNSYWNIRLSVLVEIKKQAEKEAKKKPSGAKK